jgi:ASC-1-like (ASCH) protein
MVKKKYFELHKSGKIDVELRDVKPQWKNSKTGDIAIIQSGRKNMLRKRITKIHRGSLARIFMDINYKRIFPEAATMFRAVHSIRELYPKAKEFMAFELEDV